MGQAQVVPVGAGVGFQVTEVMGPSSGGAPSGGPSAVSGHSQPVVILRCGMASPRPWLPTSVSPPPPGPGFGPGPRQQRFLGSKGCQCARGWAGPLLCGHSGCSLVETILATVSPDPFIRAPPRPAVPGLVATAQRVVYPPAPCSVPLAPYCPTRVYPGRASPSGSTVLPFEPQPQSAVLLSDRIRAQGHSEPHMYLLLIGPTGQWRFPPSVVR